MKGKAVPLRAWIGGSHSFQAIDTWGWLMSSALRTGPLSPPLPPPPTPSQEIPLVLIAVRGWIDPRVTGNICISTWHTISYLKNLHWWWLYQENSLPSDRQLFPALKRNLSWHKFEDRQVERVVIQWLMRQNTDFYQQGIEKFVPPNYK